MNLLDQDFQEKKDKKSNKTILKVVLVFIILTFLIIIGILGYMSYLQSTALKVLVNGTSNQDVKKMLVIEDDGTIYAPVKSIASIFGYTSYNGEYTNKSEENSKCYVQCDGEVANISLNSNEIYKLNIDDSNESSSNNYECIYMDKPVKAINGELYVTADGLEKVFNISFDFDNSKNRISIFTTDYLIEAYTTKVLDYGYEKLSEKFENNKTAVRNMLVVTNGKNFGVIDASDGTEILECKYDDIVYQEATGDFIVNSDGKYGVIGTDKKTKINLLYEQIKLIDYQEDSNTGLYLVQKNKKYGVIDLKGNDKIYPENDQIGIDISNFAENDLKSEYILLGNLIPVKRNEKWGLYSKDGKQIVDFDYDSFGYIANNNKEATNLLVIPDYNVMVAAVDGRYTLLNASGERPIKAFVDDIYMKINGGKKQYIMIANNKKYDVSDYLDRLGVKTTSDDDSDKKTNKTTNNSNTNTNNTNATKNNSSNNENKNNTNKDENSQEQETTTK